MSEDFGVTLGGSYGIGIAGISYCGRQSAITGDTFLGGL